MSRPVSAMIARARARLTPGISASRSTAGRAAASSPRPASGPVLPLGVGAPGGGDGVQGRLDLVLDRGYRPVEDGDVVEVDADQHGVASAESCRPGTARRRRGRR